jgi:hypothetical protein
MQNLARQRPAMFCSLHAPFCAGETSGNACTCRADDAEHRDCPARNVLQRAHGVLHSPNIACTLQTLRAACKHCVQRFAKLSRKRRKALRVSSFYQAQAGTEATLTMKSAGETPALHCSQ